MGDLTLELRRGGRGKFLGPLTQRIRKTSKLLPAFADSMRNAPNGFRAQFASEGRPAWKKSTAAKIGGKQKVRYVSKTLTQHSGRTLEHRGVYKRAWLGSSNSRLKSSSRQGKLRFGIGTSLPQTKPIQGEVTWYGRTPDGKRVEIAARKLKINRSMIRSFQTRAAIYYRDGRLK